MKVIYYGNNAIYGAYTMAAIHIGIYDEEKLPCLQDILRQWELCFIHSFQKGNLIYMGLDEDYREIYVIGCGRHGKMLEKIYNGLNSIYYIQEDIHFVKADIWEGWASFLISLNLWFPSIEPIVKKFFVSTYKRAYPKWCKKVCREKEKLKKGKKP